MPAYLYVAIQFLFYISFIDEKLITDVVDNSDKSSPVWVTPVKSFSVVSLTPVIDLY